MLVAKGNCFDFFMPDVKHLLDTGGNSNTKLIEIHIFFLYILANWWYISYFFGPSALSLLCLGVDQ